ncbi:hypothetical protein AB9P05_00660 [Roseivirga sp. BDSF3-8]|uniref:hypothetical protein n=1 Tax=Roseivirga sp. BDSF3-8 TaxID=3241598 RepID=UPI003531B7D7
MNIENYNHLTDQLKYSGFEDKLNEPLKKGMEADKKALVLNLDLRINEDRVDFKVHFRKSDSEDKYYFNKFDATLTKGNSDVKGPEHTFYRNQGVSAKEAYNMLEGRSAFKNLYNKEGQSYQAWIQIDFSQKDDKGRHPVNQYHQNYGFNLSKELDKLPVKEVSDPQQREKLEYSLRKGNRHTVEHAQTGDIYHIEANPRFKSVNVYDKNDAKIKKIPDIRLEITNKEKLAKEEKKPEDETPGQKAKAPSKGKGVGV